MDHDRDAMLPLVVRPAAPVVAAAGRRWWQRGVDAAVGYLPVLMMALLALATWWLVQNTPVPPPEKAPAPLRHEPDYEMSRFSVQHFTVQGPARSVLEGRLLRHFPDTDTLEIEGVRVQWLDDAGQRIVATAQRAVAKADGSEVELRGEARVVREPASGGDADTERFECLSDFLHVYPDEQRVLTHLPVTLIQGNTRLQAGSLDYDHRAGTLRLGGRVHGVIASATPQDHAPGMANARRGPVRPPPRSRHAS